MFDLKSPCKDCPFKIGNGEKFQLRKERLTEIFTASAFQCHKTLKDDKGKERPQQCAGLMGLLLHEDQPNEIMRFAFAVDHIKPEDINTRACYKSFGATMKAHGHA